MSKEDLKAWAKNWLAGLESIEEGHKGEPVWITSNEAVKMVLEAKNILQELVEG